MPRKKKSSRRTRGFARTPWIVLAGSLAIIGFACTRTPPAGHPTSVAHHPVVLSSATPATVVATPSPRPATPLAAASSMLPQPLPSVSAAAPLATSVPLSEPSSSPTPRAGSGRSRTAPRLALIIDDCGQWLDTERGFIALPIRLTLSVLPDVRFNHTIEREASAADQGVMLHLPMETLSGLNPGPGKITTEMGDSAIAAQIEHDLDNVALARGVNNHEGSKATADLRVMNDLMTVLARRDRFFIDSKTNHASVAEDVAAQRGVATAGRDVFLDNRADVAYTESQLRSAAAIAKQGGSAIAIGHPRLTTLAAVRAMIPELQADGIVFVLASDLTH